MRFIEIRTRLFYCWQSFVDILQHWQTSFNLIGSSTTSDIWRRHILDSAQVFQYLTKPGRLYDLGSGAGFPGIVLAILGYPEVKLIESNGKKCTFLREACRSLPLNIGIIQSRIEEFKPPIRANYITSRALAPLEKLLLYSVPLLMPDGKCMFLKGKNAETELTQALKNWSMKLHRHSSLSDADGVILEIGDITSIHGRSQHR